MTGRWVIIVVLLSVCGLLNGAAVNDKDQDPRREHPGCFIWWFLKGCPLGKVFGVDPFGIYPWKKFCSRYSAFDDLEQCKEFLEQEGIQVEVNEEAEVVEKLEQEPAKAAPVDDDAVVFDDPTTEFGTNPRIPKKIKNLKANDPLFLKKCRNSFNFYNSNLKLCRMLIGKGFKRAKREVTDTHPGCFHFWFLKDCPLGEVFGVDPFKNYPWRALCQYEGLQHMPQCHDLAFENLQ